jgi:hypothetical protein
MMQLLLFGTFGCHLCEQAEQIIKECLPDSLDLTLEIMDISGHEQWEEQYSLRIPILYHPETKKELGWPFDDWQVKEFINELSDD